MSRPCIKCSGSGYKGGGICHKCGGTGSDPYWADTRCRSCGGNIEYNVGWSNTPEYCEFCSKPRFKSCKGCGGEIKYKTYWTNVPDYCKECSQEKTKPCANPFCHGTVRYKQSWSNIPKYCECRGRAHVKCEGVCRGEIEFNCETKYPPKLCESCKQGRNVRIDQMIEAHAYKRLEKEYPELLNGAFRRQFHTHLANYFVRGIDKPISYEELKVVFLDFAEN